MLLNHNHQPTHNIKELVLNSPQKPSHHLYAPIPRRQSVTAKTKSRMKTPQANKTISIRPEANHSATATKLNIQNSSELLPNSTFSFYNNQPALSQFDNLQLQDFLKEVIVGENKVPQDKSQEIIRSLNGTWFKNTQSNQLPSSKLYNNLGIRRNRIPSKNRQSDAYIQDSSNSHHFMKQYTPPNIFPGKKIGSKRLCPSKSLLQSSQNKKNQIISQSPLKLNILRRMPQSQLKRMPHSQSKTNYYKRSQSQFQKKKSLVFNNKVNKVTPNDGLIQGTRMQLHKD